MAGKDNIWEQLADRAFVRAADGRVAFYGWGWPPGTGYWIDTADRERALRRAVRHYLWRLRIIVPAGVIVPLFFLDEGGWTPAGVVAFGLLWVTAEYWNCRRLTRGLASAPPRQRQLPTDGTTGPVVRYPKRAAAIMSMGFLLLQCFVFGPIFVYAAHFMISAGNVGVGSIASAVVLFLLPAWAIAVLVTKLWMRWIGPQPSAAEAQLVQEDKLGIQAYLRMFRPAWIFVIFLLFLGIAAAFIRN